MSRRRIQQRERRYVQEYVNDRFPAREFVVYNQVVGPPPEALAKAHPEVPLRHFRRWRFYADAVVGAEGLLVLIEAKLRKPMTGIGYLLQYEPLIRQTPELEKYWTRPLQMRLVIPRQDPRVIHAAANHNIIVDVFYKPWVGEYLRGLGLM